MITLSRAMVLAAGLGTRMRPLSEAMPKPLLPLAGRSLLDHALDRLTDAGVSDAVVNAHWLADQVAAGVNARSAPRITLQREETLLETGGGVARALPALGDAPFAVVNGDAFWLDGPHSALKRLAAAFDPDRMDGLLLLIRTAQIAGEVGRGDFMLDPMGAIRRPEEGEVSPYLFGGVQILSPAFSLNLLYNRAIEAGRLYGLVHDGVWFHLSTPADLEHAEDVLRSGVIRALF
jgi:MurNAc alpha-1-phosphate uridylyltransferase